jgi:hypothetical protein
MEGPFDQFNQALNNMIPVVLRQKQLQQDQQQFDTVMQQRQAKLMEDARQAELKAANDVIQSSMEQATTTGIELYKAGDIKGAKAALTAAERIRMQAGLPPIMQLDETGTVMLEPPDETKLGGAPSAELQDFYRINKRFPNNASEFMEFQKVAYPQKQQQQATKCRSYQQ